MDVLNVSLVTRFKTLAAKLLLARATPDVTQSEYESIERELLLLAECLRVYPTIVSEELIHMINYHLTCITAWYDEETEFYSNSSDEETEFYLDSSDAETLDEEESFDDEDDLFVTEKASYSDESDWSPSADFDSDDSRASSEEEDFDSDDSRASSEEEEFNSMSQFPH
jgi:hypothetical protein